MTTAWPGAGAVRSRLAVNSVAIIKGHRVRTCHDDSQARKVGCLAAVDELLGRGPARARSSRCVPRREEAAVHARRQRVAFRLSASTWEYGTSQACGAKAAIVSPGSGH